MRECYECKIGFWGYVSMASLLKLKPHPPSMHASIQGCTEIRQTCSAYAASIEEGLRLFSLGLQPGKVGSLVGTRPSLTNSRALSLGLQLLRHDGRCFISEQAKDERLKLDLSNSR